MSLNLLSKDQFIGFYLIDFADRVDDFTAYADQTEKRILVDLFGLAMYNDMLANPTDPKYTDLITGYDLSDMMRDFFYFLYNRDRQSISTTAGEFQSDAQNASRDPESRDKKITDAWNQGRELYYNAANFVASNQDIYDLYTETKSKPIINQYGIMRSSLYFGDYPCDHDDWFIRGAKCR